LADIASVPDVTLNDQLPFLSRDLQVLGNGCLRSEERRVGKKSASSWATSDYQSHVSVYSLRQPRRGETAAAARWSSSRPTGARAVDAETADLGAAQLLRFRA